MSKQFDSAWLKDYEARHAKDSRVGPHPGSEELHVRHRGQEKQGVEKKVRHTFRITITLKFSDLRTRDPDAAVSTIFDCLIAARRFLERHSRPPRYLRQGSKG